MLRIYSLLSLLLVINYRISSQDYTSFFTGDTSDVVVSVQPALVLAGGGPDNDDAMRWMLNRAKGGDVLVLRASGSSGYNNYLYSQLGIEVNSVETILFRNKSAANNPYILRRINEAEIIFIAGGDQTVYYNYWHDTPVGYLLQEILSAKTKVIGGTSAGMMILGNIVYTPVSSGVISEEAIGNPYHPFIESIKYVNPLQASNFENTILDTHFDQRNRSGRLLTFMARALQDQSVRTRAIACNEAVAICIDENNIARVFGEFPQYQDFVYFMEVNCEENGLPQTVLPGMPLHWSVPNKNAVVVQKLKGTTQGSAQFDLNTWEALSDYSLEHWQVENGELEKEATENKDCKLLVSKAYDFTPNDGFRIYPNPAEHIISFPFSEKVSVTDFSGKILLTSMNTDSITVKYLTSGQYLLIVQSNGRIKEYKFIKN